MRALWREAWSERARDLALVLAALAAIGIAFVWAAAPNVVAALDDMAAPKGPPTTTAYVTDYDVLRFGGQAAARGRLAWAYDASWAAPQAFDGETAKWVPFSYPPQAALLFVPMSWLPALPSYLLFEVGTLLLFATGVAGLAQGRARWAILAASAPAVALNVRLGQNGLLNAGLCAHATRLWLSGSPGVAGVLAGIATMKPHVAAGLPLAMLRHRDRRGLAVVAAVGVGMAAVALATLGPATFAGFLRSGAQSARALAEGRFPMARMASAYAVALGFGATPGFALAVHAAALVAGGVACARAVARRADPRVTAGLSVACASLLSPYGYDYDLATLCVSAALLSGDRRIGTEASVALLGWGAVAQLSGYAWSIDGGKGGVVALVLVPLVVIVGHLAGREAPMPAAAGLGDVGEEAGVAIAAA